MIYLKPMEVQDVHQFASWGSFQDELFRDYNFDIRSPQDERAWFNWKTGSLFSHYQTIFLGDRAIGYLGFKRFYPLLRVGVLGICLGAKYVNQGYGQEALKIFFHQAFHEKRARVIYLLVASYNLRAIHVYEKLGFKRLGHKYYAYVGGQPPLDREELKEARQGVFRLMDQWFLPGIKMKLSKADYHERRDHDFL